MYAPCPQCKIHATQPCECTRAVAAPHPGLARDQRGNVFSEYVIVLGTVVLTTGLALYALGVPLVRSYYLMKLFILLPIP